MPWFNTVERNSHTSSNLSVVVPTPPTPRNSKHSTHFCSASAVHVMHFASWVVAILLTDQHPSLQYSKRNQQTSLLYLSMKTSATSHHIHFHWPWYLRFRNFANKKVFLCTFPLLKCHCISNTYSIWWELGSWQFWYYWHGWTTSHASSLLDMLSATHGLYFNFYIKFKPQILWVVPTCLQTFSITKWPQNKKSLCVQQSQRM